MGIVNRYMRPAHDGSPLNSYSQQWSRVGLPNSLDGLIITNNNLVEETKDLRTKDTGGL